MNRLLILLILTLLIIVIGYHYYYKKDKRDEYEYFADNLTIDQQIRNTKNEIRDLSNQLIDLQKYISADGKVLYTEMKFKNEYIIKDYPKKPIVGAYTNDDYEKLKNIAMNDCSNNSQCKAYQIGYSSKEQNYQYWLITTDISKNMIKLDSPNDWKVNNTSIRFAVFLKNSNIYNIQSQIKTKLDYLNTLDRQKSQEVNTRISGNPPQPPTLQQPLTPPKVALPPSSGSPPPPQPLIPNIPTLTQSGIGPYGNSKYDYYANTDQPANDIRGYTPTSNIVYNRDEYNILVGKALNACSKNSSCKGVVTAYNKKNKTYNYYIKSNVVPSQFIGTKNNANFNIYERVDTFVKKPYSAPSGTNQNPINKLCADVKYNNFVGDYCEGTIPTISDINTICKLKSGYEHDKSLCQANIIDSFTNYEHFLNTNPTSQETIRKAYLKVTNKATYNSKYIKNVGNFKDKVRDMWKNSMEVYYSNPLNLGSGGVNTIVKNFEDIQRIDKTGNTFVTIIDELYKVCDKSENIKFLYCSGKNNFYNDYNELLVSSNIIADAKDF